MRRRDLIRTILHRAAFLARHAMDLHTLTADQEHSPDIGIPLRGAALCATYLRVAQDVADELAILGELDRERAERRTRAGKRALMVARHQRRMRIIAGRFKRRQA